MCHPHHEQKVQLNPRSDAPTGTKFPSPSIEPVPPTAPPVPAGAIQPWLSRASPETHTHRMPTVPKPQTHKHKPHPDPGHTTQINCRMEHFALFPFPTWDPHGITHHRGKSSSSNDTIPQNSTKDFPPLLIPLVLTPGTQDLSLPPWLNPSMVLGP